jgi:hypothetical protein
LRETIPLQHRDLQQFCDETAKGADNSRVEHDNNEKRIDFILVLVYRFGLQIFYLYKDTNKISAMPNKFGIAEREYL